MEQVNAFLTDLLGPYGPLIAMGFIGIFLILVTLPFALRKPKDPFDKLNNTKALRSAKKDGKDRLRASSGNEQLDKYANFLEPQDAEEYNAVRKHLMKAGYHTKDAVRMYHFLQFVLGLGLLALGVIYVLIRNAGDNPLGTQATLLFILGPGIAGYMAPKYWVTRRVQERQEEITNGFPDALDMMLVCVEAGQSLDQAIIRVAKEIRPGYPSLADEFEMVALELKAGKDRETVLKDMGSRVGLNDVSSFVTVLVQAQTFGTSIGEALRVFAGEMRDKRVMRAEEKANKVPTKMTLATMALTVPPLLIALVGPSIYNMLGDLQTLFN